MEESIAWDSKSVQPVGRTGGTVACFAGLSAQPKSSSGTSSLKFGKRSIALLRRGWTRLFLGDVPPVLPYGCSMAEESTSTAMPRGKA